MVYSTRRRLQQLKFVMQGTAISCDFLIELQLLAVDICTYNWGMYSKLLRVCCADTINDQVMYLRSDNTAIAMG